MKIKTVHITNYRKIIDAKINMEDNITVIAGANNSGKTSIVELFNAVFGSQKGRLGKEDIPAEDCHKWSEQVFPVFVAAFQSGKKKAEALEEVPIGCVIVHEGKIIARGYNRRNTDKNTLSHAELNAIRKASKKLGDWRLEGCTMYVTLAFILSTNMGSIVRRLGKQLMLHMRSFLLGFRIRLAMQTKTGRKSV